MAETLVLEVVTPEEQVIQGSATAVQVPALGGYVGILPGHTPLLTELGTGVLSYQSEGRTSYASVSGGIAEILPGRVTLLADAAERAEEIDVERARKALAEAEQKLAARASDSPADWEAVLHSAARARAQLEAARLGGAVSAHRET